MPFRSKAQMRKFAAMERRGELSRGTFRRWLEETPNVKKLPERVGRMADKNGNDKKFIAGAIKRQGWLRAVAKRLGMTTYEAAQHIVNQYRAGKGSWTQKDFQAAMFYLRVLRKAAKKKGE